jgi:hypothetical protein
MGAHPRLASSPGCYITQKTGHQTGLAVNFSKMQGFFDSAAKRIVTIPEKESG